MNRTEAKARLLVISTRSPYPLMGGDRIRIYNTCRTLAKRYRVDLLVLDVKGIPDSDVREIESRGVRVIPFTFSRYKYMRHALYGIFANIPLQASYYHFEAVQRWVDENISSYDLVWCNHIRSTAYVQDKQLRKIVDLHDAISLNYLRASRYARGLWRLIYRIENRRVLDYELNMVKAFDKSVIVSQIDKDFLAEHGADPDRITVIPIEIDDEYFARPPDSERDQIVFFGKMNTVANSDAALYFARDIFSIVRQSSPSTQFVIAGADPNAEVRSLGTHPGIKVTGRVHDHIPFVQQAKVVVAPMRFGAGMQNKIVQAMALGKAVVATKIGAEGIAATDGVHLFVADTPSDFAKRVMELLANQELRLSMGVAAREFACRKYSTAVVAESLFALVDQALSNA